MVSTLSRRERHGIPNMYQRPLDQDRPFTSDLSIMYSDKDTLKERDLKLYDFYKAALYTDVILKCQDESIAVHGIVLSSMSEYFNVMLQSGFKESSTKIIDFSSSFQNLSVLKIIIDYMYTGEISLRQQTLEQIIGAAHLFMLDRLKEHCAQFLLEQLQPQNALSTWRLAYLYNLIELKLVCYNLLLVVFTRNLIDQTDFGDFTSDCLSTLLNNVDLMKNLGPKDVSHLIVSWMKAGDVESRKEIAKSLILDYLKDQGLDIILESVHCLSSQNEVFTSSEKSPTIPNFVGKISWSCSQETDEGRASPLSSLPSAQLHYYGLLVYEEHCNALNLFCPENQKWFYENIYNIGQTPIGIIDSNYLVSLTNDPYAIILTNLCTKAVKHPASLLQVVIREGRVMNPSKEAVHYFCYSGSLYAIVNIWVQSSSYFVFSIYQFDVVKGWSLLLNMTQQLENQFLPGSFSRDDVNVKLHLISQNNSCVYVAAKISSNNSFISSEGWAEEGSCDSQETRYPRSICYLYNVDLSKKCSTLLSAGCLYLSNAQLVNAFFFKKKLFFPENIGDWQMSSLNFQIKCVCYDFNSDSWFREELYLPKLGVDVLPLKQKNLPRSCVKVHGSVLYFGLHQAPHIYHVYTFQFDSFQWSKLPPIPSPSVSKMTLFPISANRPLNQYSTKKTPNKLVDNSKFLFLDTTLTYCKEK